MLCSLHYQPRTGNRVEPSAHLFWLNVRTERLSTLTFVRTFSLFTSNAAIIRDAVIVIAKREGLSGDWLNDAVKGFFYTQVPNRKWAEYPGLRVYIPSLDYLLVMKVVAGRPQAIDDARALIEKLHLSDAQEVFALIEKYTKKERVEPRTQYIVEELFDS